MKKIKVLFVGLTGNLGGLEVFGRDLILNSDPKKFDFTIMLGGKVTTPFQEELVKHGVKIVRFGFRRDGYKKCLNDIRSIYENGYYDIVHINLMTYSPFELVKYACKYSSATVIVHSHNTKYKTGHFKARFMHSIGKRMIRSFKFNRIACGVDAGKYLFGGQPFEVFHNGIDFKKFKFSQKNRNEIREELGISKTDFVIGDVASFLPQKNQKFLIKSFVEIKKRKKNAKMILVGVGQELEKCKRLAKKLGVEKEILFLGNRNDIEEIYSALDVYVMPSTSEGLSIALCEAQINGLPCVTSCDVCRESDISGNVSFLKFDSVDSWVDKILAVGKKRNNKVKNISEFNIDVAVKKFYDYYESLVAKKVTVIVPTYNSENTIERCIDSVLGQNYRNLELLVVDDGSTDMTTDVVKWYMKNDERVKLVCQNHEGPNFARKKGIDLAEGEYLMFVDADDYIEKNTIGTLMNEFRKNDVDIIRFNAKRPNGKIVFPILSSGELSKIIEHDEIMDLLLNTYKLNSLCFQCYRAKDIKKISVFERNLEFGEDFLVNLALHKNTKRILAISDVMYHYCNNPKSTTQNKDYSRVMKNIADRIFVSLKVIEMGDARTTYNQLKMVKSAIMDIVKVKKCDKNKFLDDLNKVLTNKTFSNVDVDELNKYIGSLPKIERTKNQKIMNAIISADCEYIWKYACMYKMIRRVRV